jgi:ABC-2 type transport system ATP-binding protein
VALAIPAGSVCGFVGPNGAGKTTTIRMLLGLVRPTAGSGTILGGSLFEPATYLHKVGALIEAPAFYPQLSGRENLKVLARLGQLPLAAVDPVLERSGLLARAGDRYRSYSLGMKQRLGIAAAMLADPELLILDEPTNGLDPAGIVEMRGLIKSFASDGITVLVSSHLISEIEQICDYVVMIRAGRLVHQGSVAELRATQQAEFLVAPEHAADRDLLARLLQQAGCTVTPGGAEGVLLVEAAGAGAWFTGTGLGDLFRELGDLALATIGYSVLGMALGQFVRSAVFAVIVGFAWLIAVENIITRIVPSTQQWLPGASILAVASGGGEGVSYGHGLILGAVYLVVAITAAMTVFLRSDVTA